MARQYGNQTGAYGDPASSEAPGSWLGPTEIIRNKSLGRWPASALGKTTLYAGTYVYSIASGVEDNLVDSEGFYVADGSAQQRGINTELFQAIGTTYGPGDGVNTFDLPNLNSEPYVFQKTTTTSGQALTALSGVGVLPSHTHSVVGITGTNGTRTNGLGGPANAIRNTSAAASPPTHKTDQLGNPFGNVPRRRQTRVLITRTSDAAPIGALIPVLLPIAESDIGNELDNNLLIPSGQAISRNDYDTLFGYLGTHFGNGDGSTTFNLPDLRGLFTSGFPTSVAQSSGTLPSGYLVDEFARHFHDASLRRPSQGNASANNPGTLGSTFSSPATGNSSVTGDEVRPANISVVWCLVATT